MLGGRWARGGRAGKAVGMLGGRVDARNTTWSMPTDGGHAPRGVLVGARRREETVYPHELILRESFGIAACLLLLLLLAAPAEEIVVVVVAGLLLLLL